MFSCLQKHTDLLKVLKSNSQLAKSLLEEVDNGFIICSCEIVKNFLHGDLKMSSSLKTKLSKHKFVLCKLADRSLGVKHKGILLQSEDFLPLLPILVKTVGGLLLKKAIE